MTITSLPKQSTHPLATPIPKLHALLAANPPEHELQHALETDPELADELAALFDAMFPKLFK